MIPRTALIVTLLGLVPFVWGALTSLSGDLSLWSIRVLGSRFTGPYTQLSWGQIVLAFHSGALWSLAARGPAPAHHFVLAALPALWTFLTVSGGPVPATINLIVGFVMVLALDTLFERRNLTPDWWMRLRIPSSIATITCLGLGALI